MSLWDFYINNINCITLYYNYYTVPNGNTIANYYNVPKFDFPLLNFTQNTKKPKQSVMSDAKRTQLIKEYLKFAEGGFANVKGDKGGDTKHGVTHTTYDNYRKRNHLPKRSVKYMTDKEFTEIIDYFWEKSGAYKIKNPTLAFYVFATDWGSGIGKSKKFLKKCNGDPQKFEQLRRDFYNKIAVGEQAKFKRGWQNRVTRDHDFACSKLTKLDYSA